MSEAGMVKVTYKGIDYEISYWESSCCLNNYYDFEITGIFRDGNAVKLPDDDECIIYDLTIQELERS